MESPQQNFFENILDIIPEMREAINTLKEEPLNRTCQNILKVFFHRIHGTGSAIGFDELVETAKSLGDRLSALIENDQAAVAEFLKEAEDTLNTIEERINILKAVEEIELPEEQEQPLTEVLRKEVLIVEDDAAIRQAVTEELSKRNFDVTGVGNTGEAKKFLQQYFPDLIILGILPGTDGLELFKELRADQRFNWTPIFFLTSKSGPVEIMEDIKIDADDCIIKPFSEEDFVTRIEAKIRRTEELQCMAIRDPLTGVFSRSYFMERLAEEIERFSRQKKSFSVVMCAPDFFKKVIDEHGRPAGNFIFKEFASFLCSKFRRTDTIARYGGEEFIVLLPETDAPAACKVLERLRMAWGKKPLAEPYQNKHVKITFSTGIGEFYKDGKTEQDIIKAAENALYQAKETGGDKVVLSGRNGKSAQPQPLHKILVVDDSLVIRNMLLEQLKEKFQVFLAKDGEDALLQLLKIRPHLVLADLIMPIMGGLEMIKRIREDPRSKNIKIIALTGDSQKKTVLEAFQAGVDDYVVKNFDHKELEARILRLLKRKDER